jgi:hypothetical protein
MSTPAPGSRTRRRVAEALDGELSRIYAYVIHGRPPASPLSRVPNICGKPIGGGSMINSTNARPLKTMPRWSLKANKNALLHRWGLIQAWVNKFHGFLEAVRRRKESGHIMEDHVSSSFL